MSAALQQPADPWSVLHDEHPAMHPPAGPAPDAEAWGRTAVGAAQQAHVHAARAQSVADDGAQRVQAFTEAAAQAVMEATEAAQSAKAMLEEVRRTSDLNREMVAAFGVMTQAMHALVAELQRPRKMTVVKRDRNGAVAEATSEAT